jgi:uncharacterized membrane protein
MTANGLAAAAGVLLSVIFSYVPGLNAKYASLDSTWKRLIMLIALVITAGVVYGISCTGWWTWVSCDQAGIKQLIEAFVIAAIANQTAFELSPKTRMAESAKAARGIG